MKQFRHFFTITSDKKFEIVSKNLYIDKIEALEALNEITNKIADNENGFVIDWKYWNNDNEAEIVIGSEKGITTVRMYCKEVA